MPNAPKQYSGNIPKCNKCNFHHHGECREMIYTNCRRKGHTTKYCRTQLQQNQMPNNNNNTNDGANHTYYGCGRTGHFRRNCPNVNNQGAGGSGRVLTLGQGEAVQDPTIVTCMFLLNNTYACILFDSVEERSFISNKFKHLLNQRPQKLKETFTLEMANEKTESNKDIYIGCTLTLKNHSMPKKVVRLHLLNHETLIIYGDKLDTNLRLISCIKAQKCLLKKNYTFLAHIVDKTKEEINPHNIPMLCDFPDIFPEDLPGIPLEKQVEFRIDFVSGATPIAKLPYRLAPTEMKRIIKLIE
ncbi:uncharacterized protein LOC111920359 [Lactuca sativa]|uniref:uncharacterized protein LOC111920359 n=1 Tax=Lactuca sativa TaxID=4236 RepID=UPI000CD7ED5B|nr:uncharacterized protein LOC111920359 [Lactuca sativa]